MRLLGPKWVHQGPELGQEQQKPVMAMNDYQWLLIIVKLQLNRNECSFTCYW